MNEKDTLGRLYIIIEQLTLEIKQLELANKSRTNSLEAQSRRMANSPIIPVVNSVSNILIENKLYFINGELNWMSNGVYHTTGS